MLRSHSALGWMVGLCLAATPAAAAEWGASIGSGLIYSDNLERTESGDSATLATVDVAGQLVGSGESHDVDVEASLVWREYLDSRHDSDLLPQLRGEVNWAPVPEHFVWTVRDNFGQVALSPGEILQPVDRQDINVFSTGPAVTFPFGPRMNIQLAGLFSDVYYEDDVFDYNRTTGSVTVEREISGTQVVYVRGIANRTEFKDGDLGGYDYLGYYLGYDGLGARTALTAEVGVEELRNGGESSDGLYVDFDLDRNLGPRSNASLTYTSRYADSADIFALDQNLEPVLGGTANVLVSGDPVWLQLAALDLTWDGVRTSTGVVTFWSNEDADSAVVPDREIYGLGARASRWLSDAARIGASVYFTRENWSGALERKQNDRAATLEFELQLGAKVSLLTYFETYSRYDSPANYDENRLMLLVRYTPKAVSGSLPSFYERRLNRRFVPARRTEEQREQAVDPRERT